MMTSLKISSENLQIKLCLWNIFFNAFTIFSIKILWGCILPQVFFKLIRTEIILVEDLEIFKYKYLSSLITSSLLLQKYTNQILLMFTTVIYFLNFFEVHNFIRIMPGFEIAHLHLNRSDSFEYIHTAEQPCSGF